MRLNLPRPVIQAGAYALGLAISKGVSLMMVPVLTRYLPPDGYGVLEILVTLADIGSVLLGAGLAETMIRFAGAASGTAERDRIAAEVFGLALVTAVLFLVATQLAAPAITAALPPGVTLAQVRFLLLSLTVTACIEVPLSWLRMTEQAFTFVAFSAGKNVVQAALMVLALHSGWGVTGVIAAGTLCECGLALAIGWSVGRRTGIVLITPRLPQLLLYGGPLVIGGIANFVSGSLDRWILASAVGLAAMAKYALAAKFALVTFLLLQPFQLWWFARQFTVLTEAGGYQRGARTIGFGVGGAILAAATMSVVGPTAIFWLTPTAYHGAAAYVPWLAALVALQEIGNFVSVGCHCRRTGFLPMAINLTAAAVALALYMLLIPAYGIAGAIAARLVVQVVRILLFAGLGHMTAPIPYPVGRLCFLALAAVMLFAWVGPPTASAGWLVSGVAVVLALGMAALATGIVWVPRGMGAAVRAGA